MTELEDAEKRLHALGTVMAILNKKNKSLEESLEQVKTWYGINQIHIPSDEAVKMIKILEKKE